MQTVAYFGGAVLLGLVIVYGILHSRFRRPTSNQDAATKRLYEEEEKDRKRREAAASKSSNSTDVVESKTYTTGKDLAVQGAGGKCHGFAEGSRGDHFGAIAATIVPRL